MNILIKNHIDAARAYLRLATDYRIQGKATSARQMMETAFSHGAISLILASAERIMERHVPNIRTESNNQ